MKRLLFFIFINLVTLCVFSQNVNPNSLEWFKNAKFGLFIHWGLYSQTAGEWKGHPTKGGEHFMLYERIPLKEYAEIAEDFNPTEFNASDWVKKAKQAGMKYVIITAKHHDGFAMYNSASSSYDIVDRTPYAKDPMVEIIKACREEGLKFGFYYSLGRDWEDPDVPTNWPVKGGRSNTWDYPDEDNKSLAAYVDRKVIPQLTELLTNYGDIDFIWFDTPELITTEQSKRIRKLILSKQPDCLINQRIGNKQGDYDIVEQTLANEIKLEPWEACLTMGRNWSYNKYDTIYKSPDIMIRHFVDIVSKGGNLLLNIGPTGKGVFPKQTETILKAFHDWLKMNGEAIYGSRPWRVYGENLGQLENSEKVNKEFHDAEYDGTPQDRFPDFRFTCKDDVVYVIARHVNNDTYTLKSFTSEDEIVSVESLDDDIKVKWKMKDYGLNISVDNKEKNPIYVLKVILK